MDWLYHHCFHKAHVFPGHYFVGIIKWAPGTLTGLEHYPTMEKKGLKDVALAKK